MEQCVHTRGQFYECAKICHSRNLALDHLAYRVILSSVSPGIGLRELQAQGDLGVVDILDQYLHGLTYLEDLLGILNPSPGHLRDVKQSVSSAQIDECAEIGNILNSSLYNIANCDACEQFFLQFLLLSNDEIKRQVLGIFTDEIYKSLREA